jgi:dienelactone hydrolase
MNWRRVCLSAAVALAVVASSAAPAAGDMLHRADGKISDWVGDPTMLSGQSRISKGELIYDDWLYDDYGADLDQAPNQPVFRGNLAPTQGDYRYPTNAGRYGYNAADIRQLRVAADSWGMHFVVFFQTMLQRDAAAVTLAIDAGQGRYDLPEWPDGVGITAPAADYFVTSVGTSSTITTGLGQRKRLPFQATKLADNSLEVDIPWRDLPGVRGRQVKLYFLSGLADPSTGQYLQVPNGSPTSTRPGGGSVTGGNTAVFDSAFDPHETFTRFLSHWGEEVQSQALAQRNVSGLGQSVDLGALESQATEPYAPAPGRFYNRIFHSDQAFGEGIELKSGTSPNVGGSPDPQFKSPYQPYGLYIPRDYTPGTATPLLINGHSLDVNQNEYEAVSPNLYNQLGDQRSSFVITPLARGMDTWYIDSGFKDVLEAWNDLKGHYTIDDDRTAIGGYSMGGYMTYRMGLLMPDRFSAAAAYVGPPAYQLWVPPADPQPSGAYQFAGQTNNIVTNALDLPYEMNNSGADELVPPEGALAQAQTFTDLGRTHDFYFYPTADHLALIAGDQWGHTQAFLDAHPRRDTTPREVAYRRYPSMDLPQIGQRFDGAYWANGMVVRTPGDACAAGDGSCERSFGQVDATTYGFGGNRTVPTNYQSVYPGPPVPAAVTGTVRLPGAAIAKQNGFEAKLQNLQAISFDTSRMGIDPAAQITASLNVASGPGPFKLTLKGAFGPVTATLDGQPATVTPVSGGIEIALDLGTGSHQVVVRP